MDSFSKGCLFLYLQALTGNGVPELQPFGMEVEAVGGLSVERVAYDGAVQAFGVGGVYTELVGTAGLGIESNTGSIVFCIYYFIACNCRLAVFVTDHLQGAIVEVGTEGEADEAFRFLPGNRAIE